MILLSLSLPGITILISLFLSSKSKNEVGSSSLLVRHLQSSGIDSLLRRLVVYHWNVEKAGARQSCLPELSLRRLCGIDSLFQAFSGFVEGRSPSFRGAYVA